ALGALRGARPRPAHHRRKRVGQIQETMKTRGMLFSAPMVRAIIDGRKTQTRRITKLQPDKFYTDGSTGKLDGQGDWVWRRGNMPMAGMKNKYGIPGDQIWVK